MSIVSAVRAKCESAWIVHDDCSGCSEIFEKDDAGISLNGCPAPHLLVDPEKPPCLFGQSQCDLVFFAEDADSNSEWIVPIEMTTGWKKQPSKVSSQLQATTELICQHIDTAANSQKFMPILVGNIRGERMLRDFPVVFLGNDYFIKVVRDECADKTELNHGTVGDTLAALLQQWKPSSP